MQVHLVLFFLSATFDRTFNSNAFWEQLCSPTNPIDDHVFIACLSQFGCLVS